MKLLTIDASQLSQTLQSRLQKKRTRKPRAEEPAKQPEAAFLVVKHSFAPAINYDAADLAEKGRLRHIRKAREVLLDSALIPPQCVPNSKSNRLEALREEQQGLFGQFGISDLRFYTCLRVPAGSVEPELQRAVLGHLLAVDFMALAERQASDYSFHIPYRLFIDKFSLQAKLRQVGPGLGVDCEGLVKRVLEKAFGKPRPELFLFGKFSLFVREGFHEELDRILSEPAATSVLLPFVELCLMELLDRRAGGEQLPLLAARRFLVEHCGGNQLHFAKRQRRYFIERCRKRKERRLMRAFCLGLLEQLLGKIEYYPLAKVARIQAFWRGLLCRQKLRRPACEAVAAKLFALRAKPVLGRIGACLSALSLGAQAAMHEENASVLCEYTRVLLQGKQARIVGALQNRRLEALVKGAVLRKRVREFWLQLRRQKRAAAIIRKGIAELIRKCKQDYVLQRKRMDELAKKGLESQGRLLAGLNKQLQQAQLGALPLTEIKAKEEPILKKKAALSTVLYNIGFLSSSCKHYDKFSKNLASALGTTAQDDLLKVVLTDSETVCFFRNGRARVFTHGQLREVELKLPAKLLHAAFCQDTLLYIEESGFLKSRDIPLSAEAEGKEQERLSFSVRERPEEQGDLVFGLARMSQFAMRGFSMAGASQCRKLFYKRNVFDASTEVSVFQFKRPIAQLAVGDQFVVALDEGGVPYACGQNNFGQLGLGHNKPTEGLRIVEGLVRLKEVARQVGCGKAHCIVMTAAGRVFAWGSNEHFQLCLRPQKYQKYAFSPRNITGNLGLEKNVRYQLRCGKHSGYLLSSNKRLYLFGRVNLGTVVMDKPAVLSLAGAVPQGTYIVGLDVQWNRDVELVFLRVFDTKTSAFDKTATTNAQAKELFEAFTRQPSCILLPFSPAMAKYLPLSNMSSQLVEQSAQPSGVRSSRHNITAL